MFQNAPLLGCLQLTFGFPNQLYHPDHLWQVPGQRPLLAPRPAAQGRGQCTFWGRPPPAQLCRVEIALEHRHSALSPTRGGRAAAPVSAVAAVAAAAAAAAAAVVAAATGVEILPWQGKASPRETPSSSGQTSLLQPGPAFLSPQSLHQHCGRQRCTSRLTGKLLLYSFLTDRMRFFPSLSGTGFTALN